MEKGNLVKRKKKIPEGGKERNKKRVVVGVAELDVDEDKKSRFVTLEEDDALEGRHS